MTKLSSKLFSNAKLILSILKNQHYPRIKAQIESDVTALADVTLPFL